MASEYFEESLQILPLSGSDQRSTAALGSFLLSVQESNTRTNYDVNVICKATIGGIDSTTTVSAVVRRKDFATVSFQQLEHIQVWINRIMYMRKVSDNSSIAWGAIPRIRRNTNLLHSSIRKPNNQRRQKPNLDSNTQMEKRNMLISSERRQKRQPGTRTQKNNWDITYQKVINILITESW